MKKIIVFFIAVIFCGQFLSCAKRVLPTGGEGDIIPPRIFSVTPEDKSLNVNPKTKIQIKFSEWVNPKNVKNAIFISPQTDFTVKVNARNVEIIPETPFKENTSYHISFLGDITDFSGNPLAETKNIIFSTGDEIDSAYLEGRVFFENSDSLLPKVALFFDERAELHDSVLLSNPDYMTQADSAGFFRFDNISETKYRIIGFLDKNRDNKITPPEQVFLAENQISEANDFYELFSATSDTTQNKIVSVNAFSPTVLSIKLKLVTENEPFEELNIAVPQSSQTIQIDKIQRLDDNQTIAVFLKDSLQNMQYLIETKSQRIISSPDSVFFYDTVKFNGTTLTDTVNLAKLDSLLGNFISETIDTNIADTNVVDTTIEIIAVSPKLLWNFHGELLENPLWELKNEKGTSVFTTDNFVEDIPVGKYTLFLIDDRNQNQKFDIGTLFPFVAGEKRIGFSDILIARERWEAEYEIALPDVEQISDTTENAVEISEENELN